MLAGGSLFETDYVQVRRIVARSLADASDRPYDVLRKDYRFEYDQRGNGLGRECNYVIEATCLLEYEVICGGRATKRRQVSRLSGAQNDDLLPGITIRRSPGRPPLLASG